jgi:hypothetical protein
MKPVNVSLYDIEVINKGEVLVGWPKPLNVSLYDLEVISKGYDLTEDIKPISVSAYDIEVLHPYIPAEGVGPQIDYYFSGQVLEYLNSAERTIMVFNQTTFLKVGETQSTISGTFLLPSTYSGTCFITCADDLTGQSYNDLIAADTIPLPYTQ